MATLVYGANRITADSLDGVSVEDARCTYRGVFNIPDGAEATVNGDAADASQVLGDTDELIFAKPTGQKG